MLSLAFLLIVSGCLLLDYRAVSGSLTLWYDPVVDRDEVRAAYWIKDNLPIGRDVVYAADLFASEVIMSITGSPAVIGGDWSSLSASEMGRFMDSQEIFTAQSADVAHGLCERWGVDYVFLSRRMEVRSYFGYEWVHIPKASFDKFFNSQHFGLVYSSTDPVYGVRGVWILRVEEW